MPRELARNALLLVAAALIVGLSLARWQSGLSREHPAPTPRAVVKAPNVLLVLLDDAGYGQTSTFGGLISTPTLDALAEDGLRFTRFHVTALCSPTRAALLTGRNSHAVGMGTLTTGRATSPGTPRPFRNRRLSCPRS